MSNDSADSATGGSPQRRWRTPSHAEMLVVTELARAAEQNWAYELCERTGLPSGTVSPILRRLRKQGLITRRQESRTAAAKRGRPGQPRFYYELTAQGVEVASAFEATLSALNGISYALE